MKGLVIGDYFLTFELPDHPSPNDHERVARAVRQIDAQAVRVLRSVWFLKSVLDTTDLRNALTKALGPDCALVVVKATTAIANNSASGVWERVIERWKQVI